MDPPPARAMDPPETLNATGGAAPQPATEQVVTVTTTDQEKTSSKRKLRTWDEMFECLVKYKEENNGSVAVPRQYKPDKNLGECVVKIRMFQRKLTPEQRKKLEDIGFNFETRLESYERKWNEMFEELKKFKKDHGHCVVPESQRTEKDGLGKLARKYLPRSLVVKRFFLCL